MNTELKNTKPLGTHVCADGRVVYFYGFGVKAVYTFYYDVVLDQEGLVHAFPNQGSKRTVYWTYNPLREKFTQSDFDPRAVEVQTLIIEVCKLFAGRW